MYKFLFLLFFAALVTYPGFSQITYDYYKNPCKIGSPDPEATAYFIRSFEFIMQWGSEDTDSAIFYMQKAIAEDSLYAIAYATLGHLIKYSGYNGSTIEVDSISRLAEKALLINPRVGDAHTLMSWVYSMHNEPRKAIEACKKAVEVEPDHRETWLWLGVRYTEMPGKADSAIIAFNKSLEVDPNFGQPHQKLGWLYLYDKTDHKKAAYHFRQMIRLFEDFEPRDERMILGYFGLGQALIAEDKLDEAIDTLELQLQLCDSSSLLWIDNLRSWTYSELLAAHLGKAKNELDHFIDLNLGTYNKSPNDAGIVLSVIGEFDAVAGLIGSFSAADTLKQLRMPLYEQVFNTATQDDQINSAIRSKISLMDGEEHSDAVITELHRLLEKFTGREEVTREIQYSLATHYALIGESGNAMKYLKLIRESGFEDFERICREPDFISLKDDSAFIEMCTTKNR